MNREILNGTEYSRPFLHCGSGSVERIDEQKNRFSKALSISNARPDAWKSILTDIKRDVVNVSEGEDKVIVLDSKNCIFTFFRVLQELQIELSENSFLGYTVEKDLESPKDKLQSWFGTKHSGVFVGIETTDEGNGHYSFSGDRSIHVMGGDKVDELKSRLDLNTVEIKELIATSINRRLRVFSA